ncbi:hypothetical protein [Methylobacterium sp. E-045]|uniref:hypothetical protein n=1 Tax=Methylobacterium sp. E-045 TaxID=2836575 RepID=UPI001FBBB953|nr:hypothetical protein [Methylobacterium sp. E-045]MCJ2132167.1 hypothetical protein [Methylobacterium sp. E-045]
MMALDGRPALLPSLPAILLLRFNLWRLRRVTAGLKRAQARGDEKAASRWLTRGLKACADLEASQVVCRQLSNQKR